MLEKFWVFILDMEYSSHVGLTFFSFAPCTKKYNNSASNLNPKKPGSAIRVLPDHFSLLKLNSCHPHTNSVNLWQWDSNWDFCHPCYLIELCELPRFKSLILWNTSLKARLSERGHLYLFISSPQHFPQINQ